MPGSQRRPPTCSRRLSGDRSMRICAESSRLASRVSGADYIARTCGGLCVRGARPTNCTCLRHYPDHGVCARRCPMMAADRVIRWTTVGAVLGVAAVAAVASYEHATTSFGHGESDWTARLIPFMVDGLIYASSMVMLDSARRKTSVPRWRGGSWAWASRRHCSPTASRRPATCTAPAGLSRYGECEAGGKSRCVSNLRGLNVNRRPRPEGDQKRASNRRSAW
jgi:Protein of unknown function (DUF2637)